MPDFLESPRFPGHPNWGFVSEPDYGVTKAQAGRRQIRNRSYSRPLHKYTFTIGPKWDKQIAEVHEFFHALGGEEGLFRFKDWADYKSCRVHLAVTAVDQPLLMIDATHFQLVKTYTAGDRVQTRDIVKPVAGTVRIANDAAVEQLNTPTPKWSVDTTTGIVTKLGPFVGTPTSAGFEFDVPVAFDAGLPVELLDFKVQSCTVVLQEQQMNPEDL